MNFKITKDWLERRLAQSDDANAAAGGTSLADLQRDAEARTVTLSVLAGVPNEIGRVVRFVREQRGWSRNELAELAQIDEEEVIKIESIASYEVAPRTAMHLADVCGFSRTRFQQLARHTAQTPDISRSIQEYRFAANSKGVNEVSDDEFEAVRALVDVLSEKK